MKETDRKGIDMMVEPEKIMIEFRFLIYDFHMKFFFIAAESHSLPNYSHFEVYGVVRF